MTTNPYSKGLDDVAKSIWHEPGEKPDLEATIVFLCTSHTIKSHYRPNMAWNPNIPWCYEEDLARMLNDMRKAEKEPAREKSDELFFHDRKLYDIAAVAAREKWPSTERYSEHLLKLIESIIVEGRQAGEFERKTPLDEATLAIYMVMCPFINPIELQYNLETAPTAAILLPSLILRSLAP